MWPREHGVYAQLGFPLVGAVGLTGPTVKGLSLALAFVLVFLAHEPFLVLSGRRGARARAEAGGRAKRWCVLYLLLAAAAAAWGFAKADAASRWALVALVPGAAGLAMLVSRGLEKTLLGESTVSVLTAAVSVPVGWSSGGEKSVVLYMAAVWATVGVLGTLGVQSILQDRRGGVGSLRPVTASLALFAWSMSLGVAWVRPLAPGSAVIFVLTMAGVHPRHLRRVGLTMVAAYAMTLVMLWLRNTS